MHLRRPPLALPTVSGEPIVDGYLNPPATLITPAPRQLNEKPPCDRYLESLSDCTSSTPSFYRLRKEVQATCLCPHDSYSFDDESYSFDDDVWSCFVQALDTDDDENESFSTWINFCLINHTSSPTTTPPRPPSSSTPTSSHVASYSVTSVGHPATTPPSTSTSTHASSPNHAAEIAEVVLGVTGGLGLVVVGVIALYKKVIAR